MRCWRAAMKRSAYSLRRTPNPTSGFLLFVPRKDVIMLDMSIEDGAKLIISAGLVTPEVTQKRLAELAAKAKAQAGETSPEKPRKSAPKKAPARKTTAAARTPAARKSQA